MPKCVKIQRKKRQPCIGDMDELITLQGRTLTPPTSGVDATEEFADTNPDVWALIETVNGETIFDKTGTERDVTHDIYVNFISGVTSEIWVLFNNDRLEVLSVEDLDGRHEFLFLKATNRGIETNEANRA